MGRDARDTGRRLSKDDLRLLPADGVANRVQDWMKSPGGAHFAEKRHALEHLHLVAGDVVDAPYLIVLQSPNPWPLPQQRGRGFELTIPPRPIPLTPFPAGKGELARPIPFNPFPAGKLGTER